MQQKKGAGPSVYSDKGTEQGRERTWDMSYPNPLPLRSDTYGLNSHLEQTDFISL